MWGHMVAMEWSMVDVLVVLPNKLPKRDGWDVCLYIGLAEPKVLAVAGI